MNNQGNHMVTRCNWDTIFDSKSLAGEFQMKISHWSTHHLQRAINTVFDELCPEGQTIKIKKLEINLGVLMYEDLLSQLSLKVKEVLKKQLQKCFRFIVY